MRRLQYINELAGLLVVGVRRERDVVDGHLEGQLLARHRGDLLGLRQNRLG